MSAQITQTPDTDTCPQCGLHFRGIMMHWQKSSSCDYMDYPDALFDVLRGLMSVRGCIERGNPYNRFVIHFPDARRAKFIRSVFGLYANGIESRQNTDLDNNPLEHPQDETYRMRLSPNPHIQSYDDLNFQDGGLLAVKSALYSKSVERNGFRQVQIPEKRKVFFERLIPEYSSKHEFESGHESTLINYTIPKQIVEQCETTCWPKGWWNKRYVD